MTNGADSSEPTEGLVPADGYPEDNGLKVDQNDPAILAEAARRIGRLRAPEGGTDGDVVLVSRTGFERLVLEAVSVKEERRRAMELARVDSLTEIPNRRAIVGTLDVEIGRAKRHKKPVSLILIDVDHFKEVNDTKGHHAGDAVLKDLVGVFKKLLRIGSGDVLGRLGGDEFVAFLPDTNGEAALVGERLRAEVEAWAKAHDLDVTLSVGVATYYPDLPMHEGSSNPQQDLINRADKAMYRAKKGGRNRVFVINEKTAGEREPSEPFELTPGIIEELQAAYGKERPVA
jgi:diguanylate cyclase (GGDEF)-like protein